MLSGLINSVCPLISLFGAPGLINQLGWVTWVGGYLNMPCIETNNIADDRKKRERTYVQE